MQSYFLKLSLLITILCAQSFGAIAFSSCATALWASGTTVAVTISPAAGNTIIVGWSDRSASGFTTISSVSDGSNAYTVPAGAASSANAPRTSMAHVLSSTGSPTTVTVTLSGTPALAGRAIVCLYTGIISIGNLAASGSASSGTNPNISVTMQDTNNFNVCMMGNSSGSSVAWTNNQGTMRSPTSTNSQTIGAMADNTSSSTGALICGATEITETWQASGIELRTSSSSTNSIMLLLGTWFLGWWI